MTKVGERAADELVRVIAEHMADGRGDVEECALERDDVKEVGGAVEEEHVKGLVAIIGIERDGLGRAVGKGERGGGVGGGGKTERGYEGGIDEEGAEVLGGAAHGHGGRPPVASGSWDGHGGFVGVIDDVGAVFKL